MSEAKKLSNIIGEIYEAALDPSLREDVVDKIVHFVGGPSTLPLPANAVSLDENNSQNDKAISRQPLFDRHLTLDPANPIEGLAPAVDLARDGSLELQVRGTPYQGSVDWVSSVLDRLATATELTALHHGGAVTEGVQRRVQLVVPHIRRAMEVSRSIDLESARATMFADTIDILTAGLCLVRADGSIVHANAAFQAILAAGDYLSTTDGRLVATDQELDQNLRELFASADGRDAVRDGDVTLPLKSSDGENHIIHVLPLARGARRPSGIATRAVAVLLVHKTRLALPSRPETIAVHYKLTPTELRVLLAIVHIGGVPEVADALGIAHTTVKTHLGRLFAKTGANRQADLVKLVAGFSTPIF